MRYTNTWLLLLLLLLSSDKAEWRLISAALSRRRHCFLADQLWFTTRIQEEEESLELVICSDSGCLTVEHRAVCCQSVCWQTLTQLRPSSKRITQHRHRLQAQQRKPLPVLPMSSTACKNMTMSSSSSRFAANKIYKILQNSTKMWKFRRKWQILWPGLKFRSPQKTVVPILIT